MLRGKLVIVPTRELHAAPFAALKVAGSCLIESVTTSVAPSALSLALLRRKRPGGRGSLVAGLDDARIPQARTEAREVAALLPGSRLLAGAEATRSAFRAGVRGRAFVHLATHGAFRPERPTLSSLVLADGALTLKDVLELPLCAGLVALTACESGRSDVGPGDDLTGLANAFLLAGARSVLVSPGGLDDVQARRTMRAFYGRLLSRPADGPAEALRHALRETGRGASHPFAWASLVVVGAG